MASSEPAYERLGAKLLSLPDVVAQSVGFMGPVFSSAFVIPLVVGVISASGKGGGVASPLSVLIAAVGVFALGWIVSRYVKQVHAAGSLYDYVTRGLGERVGTAAGWLYYGGVTVLLTGLLLLIGGYLQSTIAAEFKVNPLPSWAWTMLLIALVVLFDMIAVAIGCAVSASRGFFAMARDRRIPGILARTSQRHGSPLGATVFLTGAAVLTLLVNQFWTGLFALPGTPHYVALFAWGSTFGGFALVVVYLLMSVGALRNYGRSDGKVALIIAAVIGILITGGAIFGSFYKVTRPTIWAPWLALGLLVVGLGSTWILRPRLAASTQLADLAAAPGPGERPVGTG